jgi:hypothetical protein
LQLIFLLLLAVSAQGYAQRRLVVVDVETLIPVVGANVVSKDGTTVTDSLGYFSVSDSCQSLSFTHVNYESRIINLTEVCDTVYMISKLLNIREVVVFGHGKHEEISDDLKKKLRMDKIDAQLAAANPNGGINLIALFKKLMPKKWLQKLRKNTKQERLKRIQKMLDEY